MKKTITMLCIATNVVMMAGSASAQVSGTNAYNFTVSDIDGNSHTLNDYLNAGKTVILDVFATWCGPCQNSVGTLDDIYADFGPSGTNEVMVLSLEADMNTTDEASYKSTYGVTNPIVALDSYLITSQFDWGDLGYSYPSFYVICPDGTWKGFAGYSSLAQLDSDLRGDLADCGLNNIEEVSNTISVSVYPNPQISGESVQITVGTEQSSETKISVYSTIGQLVSSQTTQLVAGENTLEIETGNFVSGVYLISVETEGNRTTQKLIIE